MTDNERQMHLYDLSQELGTRKAISALCDLWQFLIGTENQHDADVVKECINTIKVKVLHEDRM